MASADLAAAAWTITATAAMARISPLAYLRDYLDACARARQGTRRARRWPRCYPWAAADADLAAWRPGRPAIRPDTTEAAAAWPAPAP